MQPTVCLNMIVRDEAAVIERCLASVRAHIDYWVIVDTGSVDDTPARIERALAGVPGELHRSPWRDFGHNRNDALRRARDKADYLLFIDADEQLEVDAGPARPALAAEAYSLETCFGALRYDRVALVSTALPWRWVGVLHEYLEADAPVAQPRLPGFRIRVTPDGARSRDPAKFDKDAAVLREALAREPDNARYAFYLAQSYRDAGKPELALRYYRQRADMGGWDEEVWYSRFQVAILSEHLQAPRETVIDAYLAAHACRPRRAEALTALATYLRGRQDWELAYLFARAASDIPMPGDRLFVDATVYRWRASDELALAAFYSGRAERAGRLWRQLLDSGELPASERDRVRQNLTYIAP
ncbi:tetratricopeptide repeat-containing glycosyltransferase [Parahaliea mediterranea]|uniref:Glycosyltransferase family 2 protein n=1 Tax=Parahaliea mediterranea TaxID=651086 RepID=A0A939DC66_9GAMM|nr:glycosyltransferase [Parahaliea mediterranea]MBN7795538.1 glycosyltransferase family 2 protein [Parahaliea mediterranea]